MRTPIPLAGSYAAAVALALLALCPNIVFTTAFPLLQSAIVQALDASSFSVRLAEALSNAAYAFGAIAAADLASRFSQRRLFLIYESVFIAGSLLALCSPGPIAFAFGRVLQGLGTGLLLVAALPPLVTQFSVAKLPVTAIWINIGLFGAVTVGPLTGGLTAHFEAWRALFAALAVLGSCGCVLAFLTLELAPGYDPGRPIDGFAFPLAAAATALPFFGVSWLSATSFAAPGFFVPVIVGLLALAVLIVSQYHKKQAFIPVGPLFSTFPLAGILTAMIGGAAFVTLLELTIEFLLQVDSRGKLVTGLLMTPELFGLIAAAYLFYRALPSRWLSGLALSGLLAIIAGAAVLTVLRAANATIVVPVAAALLGYGAGAAVAPGLFVAGLSVVSTQLGRTFALVELLRSEAAFLIGPVLLSVAMAFAPPLAAGLRLSIWITFAIAVAGTVGIAILFALGGAWPQRPDLEAWLLHHGRALRSPPIAAARRCQKK